MEKVTIAVGSNVGDRQRHMSEAKSFLESVSNGKTTASSLWLTEPVGPASRYYLNGIVSIHTPEAPPSLIDIFKGYEKKHGRSSDQPRWSARTIDLDIIACGNLVVQEDTLIIPHPEYHKRLFVLKPLAEIEPGWRDPVTGSSIDTLIASAPEILLKRTELHW